ncbi:SWIM zinc finger family protein [Methanocella conradii]|uniref:SWIM zinc finger family protein n=1 Tax=Methanocella conradii TaxID=1175444 RepID=UPI0024B33BCD|nr:SWIM zinc finger family protein [Methanocella conradii]MDI6896129.1 SWIM zinc finger family protein [Methanocella conradii]
MDARAPSIAHGLRELKEDEVRRLFEERVFERGVRYFEQGRVVRPFIYGDSIMAECRGTLPQNYQVRVDVRGGRLVASCTCPYAFGYCKHMAAVLYGWLKNPGMYKDLGQSESLLKKMDKDTLVEIVVDMIKYDPDAFYVVSLRLLPRAEVKGFVEREMRAIFSREYVDYLNVREIVKRLDIFREYSSDVFRSGDFEAAMDALAPVIEAVVENYTSLDDADGLMRNFFATAMDLYGDVAAAYRLDGERRGFLSRALEWYLEAEWGLERVIMDFLIKEAGRLGELEFMLDLAELKMADYKRSFITMGPTYSEEYEYVEERLERLEALRAGAMGTVADKKMS